jgi:hypothetical protein
MALSLKCCRRSRARLVDFYRPDILALEDIIHRDLRSWMQ